MANTNMQLGEWLIKQGSNGDIVVQNQDGSGVVVKSGSDDIVTHIFHWFLSDALLANAAQSEAVAASVGEGVPVGIKYNFDNERAVRIFNQMPEWMKSYQLTKYKTRLSEEERDHLTTIDQRDHAEAMADKLATAIAEYFNLEIGEHSSMNDPWQNALDDMPAAPPASASVGEGVPDGYVMLPKSLTAENGAKALLMGEFSQTVEVLNPDHDHDCPDPLEPEMMTMEIAVSWDNIKRIYERVVEHYGTVPPASAADGFKARLIAASLTARPTKTIMG